MTLCRSALLLCLLLLLPGPVLAQAGLGLDSVRALRQEFVSSNHWRGTGAVEIDHGDMKFYAEQVDYFADTSLLVASGQVAFSSADHRIAAERMEFDVKTRTGVFYVASGSASLGEDGADRSLFGTQEPDAYFYGETLEKLGPKRYRITNGGFTTCVQPTPRWEIASGSVTINLDDYALLRNAVFRVKGVPLLYLPVMYYPLQEDDRATGFLLPSYGVSTIRGQSISNAFFWAINRSQDATLFHDWFSRTGQGTGAEYRYVAAPGSQGSARMYLLNERAVEFPLTGGGTSLQPARRSYTVTGGATHVLTPRIRARAQVDYFSDVTVQQLYNQDIYQASNRRRTYGGNITGSWGAQTLSGTYDRMETFVGLDQSAIRGAMPRVSFTRAERPLGQLPIYVALGSEVARLVQDARTGTQAFEEGLTRLDVSPGVRVPFTRWPFLTVNSSLAWRGTYWTESLDPVTRVRTDEGVTRGFFEMRSRVTGPVFNRIFNTPGNWYAQRFKHVIEPSVTFQRTTQIENFDRIVKLEGADWIVGGTTTIGYGVASRLYAKRGEGPAAPAREVVTVSLDQRYFTDARASQYDRERRDAFGTAPTNFSPVALAVRVSPADGIHGTFFADYDVQHRAIRSLTASGALAVRAWLQTSAGWTQRRFIDGLPGFDDRERLDHSLNAATTVRSRGNRFGGVYSFDYDVLRDRLLQQRILGYYNAQCCGVGVEFQTFNFAGLGARAPVVRDRRFNISFTLAGIGTFSNPFGAFGGDPRTR